MADKCDLRKILAVRIRVTRYPEYIVIPERASRREILYTNTLLHKHKYYYTHIGSIHIKLCMLCIGDFRDRYRLVAVDTLTWNSWPTLAAL